MIQRYLWLRHDPSILTPSSLLRVDLMMLSKPKLEQIWKSDTWEDEGLNIKERMTSKRCKDGDIHGAALSEPTRSDMPSASIPGLSPRYHVFAVPTGEPCKSRRRDIRMLVASRGHRHGHTTALKAAIWIDRGQREKVQP